MRRGIVAVLSLCAIAPVLIQAFYLPGMAPIEYVEGESVMLKVWPPLATWSTCYMPAGVAQVNKLDSVKTQLPYRYYELPFCRPPKDQLQEENENLGEILGGDVIETSRYTGRRRRHPLGG